MGGWGARIASAGGDRLGRSQIQVRKAVILAGGLGTRLLPVTKALPKEMLPVVDKPVIHYAVEELVAAGIKQVIIVSAAGKRAVEDYFDRSRETEESLERKRDYARLQELRAISEMADIAYVRQREPLGLGHAVLAARHLIDDEPFLLLLPDDIILADPPVSRQAIDCFLEYRGSVVAVQEVPREEVASYGIVAGDRVSDRVTRLRVLVEKPRPEDAPGTQAIVGRYVFTPSILEMIDRTHTGHGGELQITDAMQFMADEEGMYSYLFDGRRFDTGLGPLSLLTASIEIGLRRADIGAELRRYLRSLPLNEA
jgi:UTP--glucose-1-phosphate uridylyltransferase